MQPFGGDFGVFETSRLPPPSLFEEEPDASHDQQNRRHDQPPGADERPHHYRRPGKPEYPVREREQLSAATIEDGRAQGEPDRERDGRQCDRPDDQSAHRDRADHRFEEEAQSTQPDDESDGDRAGFQVERRAHVFPPRTVRGRSTIWRRTSDRRSVSN
mgnify:CR=1 FL=1